MADAALTPLGVMVLALLGENDMHPYEMARLMRQRRDDRMVTITNGTLYHTVARLKGQGLIDEVGTDRDGNRPERTTYTLTPTGREALPAWVRRELGAIGRHTQFQVAMAEAHNIERGDAVAQLSVRRDLLAEQIADIADGLDDAASRGVPAQYLLELERQRALMQAEIAWLDTTIPRIDDPDFVWGPDHEHHSAQRKARTNG